MPRSNVPDDQAKSSSNRLHNFSAISTGLDCIPRLSMDLDSPLKHHQRDDCDTPGLATPTEAVLNSKDERTRQMFLAYRDGYTNGNCRGLGMISASKRRRR